MSGDVLLLLLSDDGEDSREARRMLTDAKVWFAEVQCKYRPAKPFDFTAPTLVTPEVGSIDRLDGIRLYLGTACFRHNNSHRDHTD